MIRFLAHLCLDLWTINRGLASLLYIFKSVRLVVNGECCVCRHGPSGPVTQFSLSIGNNETKSNDRPVPTLRSACVMLWCVRCVELSYLSKSTYLSL